MGNKNQELLIKLDLMETKTEELLNEFLGLSIPTISGAKGHWQGFKMRRQAWGNWRNFKNTYKLKDDIESIKHWIDSVPQLSSLSNDQINNAISNSIGKLNLNIGIKQKYKESDIGDLFNQLAMYALRNQARVNRRGEYNPTNNNISNPSPTSPTSPTTGGENMHPLMNDSDDDNLINGISRLSGRRLMKAKQIKSDVDAGIADPILSKKIHNVLFRLSNKPGLYSSDDINTEVYKAYLKYCKSRGIDDADQIIVGGNDPLKRRPANAA